MPPAGIMQRLADATDRYQDNPDSTFYTYMSEVIDIMRNYVVKLPAAILISLLVVSIGPWGPRSREELPKWFRHWMPDILDIVNGLNELSKSPEPPTKEISALKAFTQRMAALITAGISVEAALLATKQTIGVEIPQRTAYKIMLDRGMRLPMENLWMTWLGRLNRRSRRTSAAGKYQANYQANTTLLQTPSGDSARPRRSKRGYKR